ncbi:MAG: hypothetical protein KAT57_06300, partial [Candidatus Lokiarchaeota archaeon]|nr:hypothetical protein [Candidatus Lokiarchaeota archaeon]
SHHLHQIMAWLQRMQRKIMESLKLEVLPIMWKILFSFFYHLFIFLNFFTISFPFLLFKCLQSSFIEDIMTFPKSLIISMCIAPDEILDVFSDFYIMSFSI